MAGNQWVMDPAMSNFHVQPDFIPGDMIGMGQYPMDGGIPGGREPSQRTLSGSGFTLTSPPPGKSIAFNRYGTIYYGWWLSRG